MKDSETEIVRSGECGETIRRREGLRDRQRERYQTAGPKS